MMISSDCMTCMIRNVHTRSLGFPISELDRSLFLQEVISLVLSGIGKQNVQRMLFDIDQIVFERFGIRDDFSEIKREHNMRLLSLAERLRAIINEAPDPLRSAICHAQAGNYIDLAIINYKDEDMLQMLEEAALRELPEATCQALEKDLEKAKTLVYLLDNAGEIVLDMLLIEQIKHRYPALLVTAVVRGAPVSNDCTLEDAKQVGLDRLVPVISNGSPLAGTDLNGLSPEAERAIRQADVLMAKGQANYETLCPCGLNIYYLFLCKCDWFIRRYKLPRNAPVFINEREVELSPFVD